MALRLAGTGKGFLALFYKQIFNFENLKFLLIVVAAA